MTAVGGIRWSWFGSVVFSSSNKGLPGSSLKPVFVFVWELLGVGACMLGVGGVSRREGRRRLDHRNVGYSSQRQE